MKKIALFFVLMFIIVFSFITGCSTSSPTAAATAVPTPIGGSSAFVSVPGGTYTQTDGTTSFNHTISAFKMGKYEVTYELWYTVYKWAVANGYLFANAGRQGSNGDIGKAPADADYEPVTTVNWRDVIIWCNAFSQKSGLTSVYYSDAGFSAAIKDSTGGDYSNSLNTTPGSFDNPFVKWNANGYRLPTEGEWQYAASYIDGANWTPYNYASGAAGDYNNATATGLAAWYIANSEYITHNVGNKTANNLGIYDMSGNVYELCWDWYGNYPAASTDYRGPASGVLRVLRGGSYHFDADFMQVGYRYSREPYVANNLIYGFRFARSN